MPNFNAYISDSSAISPTPRAVAAWRRINDVPTEITIKRADGTTLDPQTVRIEFNPNASQASGAAGVSSVREGTVFGIVGYPDANVPDTDIEKGDRFIVNNTEYRVIDTVYLPGEVQAEIARVS